MCFSLILWEISIGLLPNIYSQTIDRLYTCLVYRAHTALLLSASFTINIHGLWIETINSVTVQQNDNVTQQAPCRVYAGCPSCLQCTHFTQGEVVYPVTRGGSNGQSFTWVHPIGPQGFISHEIQRVSHHRDQHMTTEISPSPASSSPVSFTQVSLYHFKKMMQKAMTKQEMATAM